MRRAHAVGRVLWRLGSQHRAVRGGVAAAKSVGKATARTTRILVLEITGFFFAVFALMGLGAAWREWVRIETAQSSAPPGTLPFLSLSVRCSSTSPQALFGVHDA
jgi:hypothetical protein